MPARPLPFADSERLLSLTSRHESFASLLRQPVYHFQLFPMYDVGYVGMSKELDFVAYTRYMVFGGDQELVQKDTGWRIYAHCHGQRFFSSVERLLRSDELQPGQVNWGSTNPQPMPGAIRMWLWHVFAGGSKFTCSYRFRAPLYGYEAYHYGMLALTGSLPLPRPGICKVYSGNSGTAETV